MSRGLFWFRRDLRLADNPALERACRSHDALLLVYVDEAADAGFDASRAWLRRSLDALAVDVARIGGRLHVLAGDAEQVIPALAAATGAEAVHVSALHEPDADARDARLARALARGGVVLRRSAGRLMTDPEMVLSKVSTPYRVFTPFLKAARPGWRYRPRAAPRRLACFGLPEGMQRLQATLAAPAPDWDRGFWETWTPGERAAQQRLERFLEHLDDYPGQRDRPAIDATSRLSPHLHFGEISPARALDAALRRGGPGTDKFVAELGWREFGYYVLNHWPHSTTDNFNPRFDGIAWRRDEAALEAWRRGRTGVPLVDAGMRQLWHEGWMHNRVRMVVASYLSKHIGIHWASGAAWFMHTLVDADLANNTLGWQWVAGSGVDAAPYHRVFNPVTQSRRFDPEGVYLRRWLPELRRLDDDRIHAPWEKGGAPRGYPSRPIVDLAEGRAEALQRLARASD
ncbi:cryptochrome/photolyase family protein [Marilutibacter maris]|uniref:Deoxyribodipyrimidine photolyase n=1 Tax=Marilutibacter maris TaxID=1605891 RepID=A0A2U9T9V8_9GAMM|nr:deoxyribodipyrimidine photo-lyase [Lysobacter maris]AWV08185.1 deoxyribodipyrimidine photolyase [Lysobacter maris]